MSTNEPTITELTVTEHAGARLDRWLTMQMPERSRSEVQRWIKDGRVQIDGSMAKASQKVEAGQSVRVNIPLPVAVETLQPEAIALDIIYEDAICS